MNDPDAMDGTAPLRGRVALVTGSSRGIGAGIATALAEAGAAVAVNYRSSRQAGEDLASELAGGGVEARAYGADVTDAAAADGLASAVLADFGKVDILVNNAGIGAIHVGRPKLADATPEQVLKLFSHHVLGSLHLCRALIPQMRDLERADIVMVSSQATQMYNPLFGTYSIAKAGMEAMAYTLAKEERAHGIRVNVVAPGIVETDMARKLFAETQDIHDLRQVDPSLPFGFMCQPSDIGDAVTFLCSEAGRYITNQRITINGGGF